MALKTPKLTHERLLQTLRYSKGTGALTWLGRSGKRKTGRPAGSLDSGGYVRVLIDGEMLLGQRLAWFYVHGAWPDKPVGLLNGRRSDLRWKNLRLLVANEAIGVDLTVERLRSVLNYDAETGVFRWINLSSKRAPIGSEAGVVTAAGYRYICVDRGKYLAHRLAWFYMTGKWPADCIDHVNMVRSDNRFDNLREATTAENSRNAPLRSTNKSGFKGVSWSARRGMWHARIVMNYTTHVLGYFDTKEQAHEAYQIAARRLHGEFARP